MKCYLYVILVLLGSAGIIQAKVNTITSEARFARKLRKEELVVALLYHRDKNTDKEIRKKISRLKDMFKSTSRRGAYVDADIAFVQVNTAKRDLNIIAQRYNITQFPTFMLFDRGEPVRDKKNQMALLIGFASRNTLEGFIDTFFAERIEEIRKEREEERERRRRARRYYGPGVYFGYGYPYWGYPYWGYYPYYYGYPGFGFGFYW